jgi:hypothetical protein
VAVRARDVRALPRIVLAGWFIRARHIAAGSAARVALGVVCARRHPLTVTTGTRRRQPRCFVLA